MQRRHLRPPSLTGRRLIAADERAPVGCAKVQAGFPSLRLHDHLEPEVTA